MAPHSSTLAWKLPWTKEPGRLQSMGSLKSRTWLSDFTFTFHFDALEKKMATHSSVLAWRLPGTGEPCGLPSMESHKVGHDWSDLAAAAAAAALTIALILWTFVGKVMSLLFNMLSRLVIALLSMSKHLLISWLQSTSGVILAPQKIVCHCFRCFPIYLPWSDGIRCHDLHLLNVEF